MTDSGAGANGNSGIINLGTLTMQRSGARYGFSPGCSGIYNAGTLTMTQSVIMRNTARGGAGGGLLDRMTLIMSGLSCMGEVFSILAP